MLIDLLDLGLVLYAGDFCRVLLPYIAIAAMRRKFSAVQTSLNSHRALSRPRMLNCRNPSTCLIQPFGGSTMALRLRYLARPSRLCSLAAFAAV